MPPVAAQRAAKTPITNAIAEPDLFCAASFFARSIMSSTPPGATEPANFSSDSKAPLPNRPSRPIKRITVGRNASRALKATCCERPMQSSSMNCFAVRLKTSRHSPKPSFRGLRGVAPARAVSVVAVDKGERAELRLRRPFPAAAREQPHRRADSAGEEETRPERAGGDDRQLRPELGADVGDLRDAAAELLDRVGQLLALGLDVAANLGRRASVTRCHCSSKPPSFAWPLRSPAPARAASPS